MVMLIQLPKTIRITDQEQIPLRNLIILAVIFLLSLYPFVIESFEPTSFFLGLPDWYWISGIILTIIYTLTYYYANLVTRNMGNYPKNEANTSDRDG
jgi:hypothetical protein